MEFKVTEILGWNTIRVTPNWSYLDIIGSEVSISGYDISVTGLPIIVAEEICKNRLRDLFLGKNVKLAHPGVLLDSIKNDCTLRCSVFCEGTDISIYFPDFHKKGRIQKFLNRFKRN